MITVFNQIYPIFIAVDEASQDPRLQKAEKIYHFQKQMVSEILEKSKTSPVALIQHDESDVQSAFFSCFNLIEAAGGIVKNRNGELLFIYRRGKWDLPKGKMEDHESQQDSAVREITEETGIAPLINTGKITETYHLYDLDSTQVLKITHWFAFETISEQDGTPQGEEEITQVEWFAPDALSIPLSNTFENIKLVVNTYLSILR